MAGQPARGLVDTVSDAEYTSLLVPNLETRGKKDAGALDLIALAGLVSKRFDLNVPTSRNETVLLALFHWALEHDTAFRGRIGHAELGLYKHTSVAEASFPLLDGYLTADEASANVLCKQYKDYKSNNELREFINHIGVQAKATSNATLPISSFKSKRFVHSKTSQKLTLQEILMTHLGIVKIILVSNSTISDPGDHSRVVLLDYQRAWTSSFKDIKTAKAIVEFIGPWIKSRLGMGPALDTECDDNDRDFDPGTLAPETLSIALDVSSSSTPSFGATMTKRALSPTSHDLTTQDVSYHSRRVRAMAEQEEEKAQQEREKTKQEREKTKQEREKTKQEEERTKQERLKTILLEKQLT
ncbi:hypothetical protein SDRG_17265 [Saprolegnia diclina VS20]|uniref:Uncharacterized protein n=1 Tax=Saprolegnia diclina (strain VS20) TaxID=1156394 RepID=T0QYL4_SAPDV|nr:hypothetical protein SDRG_17265 [Saprolegnia diclina VS20]EQC24843.1 hypothetical protein SDRG_17265 [Saprolegnia diclina VS20]|eukprot:XP_008621727.1 hypothetical protein SDRG_17265 [Saprolegnia diclina VS20]